ncbi:MAG: hypothetical protein CL777_03285 [Chloroflexi bacterium]|nr:hypothetical protein [Chloroflexota bacterium]|tara:strand:- start:23508 stop:24644 length:1137 start_codon:yes stop_codon:yes gene_type:complete
MKNGFKIFDSDIHVVEPANLFQDYLEGEYRSRMPVMQRSDLTGVDTWVIDGIQFPIWNEWPEFLEANKGLKQKKQSTEFHIHAFDNKFDPITTLAAMDLEGVDIAALFRTNGGTWILGLDDLEPEYATALCRAYNNWMYDYCQVSPSRLKGIALLPLQAVDMAIEEARRAVLELGFVGVTLHPEPVNGRLLYDSELEPLWDALEKLNVAVCLHGTSTAPGREDISRKYLRHPAGRTLTHAISFPSQIMGAMGGLILSGVMERHPQLRFAFLEANCSWLSWFLYRIDDQQQKYTDSPLILKPSEYFYRQCMISMEADEHLALPWINATNGKFTVISTDYPHPDSAFPDSMNEFFDLDIKADVRRKILWDNCIRLYGIKD